MQTLDRCVYPGGRCGGLGCGFGGPQPCGEECKWRNADVDRLNECRLRRWCFSPLVTVPVFDDVVWHTVVFGSPRGWWGLGGLANRVTGLEA